MSVSITWTTTTWSELSNYSSISAFLELVRNFLQEINIMVFEYLSSLSSNSAEWQTSVEVLSLVALAALGLYGGHVYQFVSAWASASLARILGLLSGPTAATESAKSKGHLDWHEPALDVTEASDEDDPLALQIIMTPAPKPAARNHFAGQRSIRRSRKKKGGKGLTFSQKFEMIPEEEQDGNEDDTEHDDPTQDSSTQIAEDEAATVTRSNASPPPPSMNSLENSQASQPSSSGRFKRSLVIPAAELRSHLRKSQSVPAKCLMKQKYAVSTSALLKAVQQDRQSRTSLTRRASSLSQLEGLEPLMAEFTEEQRSDEDNNNKHENEESDEVAVMIETRRRTRRQSTQTPRNNSDPLPQPQHQTPVPGGQSSSLTTNRLRFAEKSSANLGGSLSSSSSSTRKRDYLHRQPPAFYSSGGSRHSSTRRSGTKHLVEDCRILERMFDQMNE